MNLSCLTRFLPFALFAFFAMSLPEPAHAVGDGATRFNLYIPGNNSHSSRRVLLIVTSVSPESNRIDIIDDDADGDSDDSALGVVLERGES
ncbi:MAG: hypothetical protein AAFQ82_15835, partial [Myxococcota bacterium]